MIFIFGKGECVEMAKKLTVKEFSEKVISLGGDVVDYFIDNTGLTSERIKELYNSEENNDFENIVYYIYKKKQLPSESYELVCDWIQDSLREAHATIPFSEIPSEEKDKDEVFNYIYNKSLKALISWANKEIKSCEGGKLLKSKLLDTNKVIEQKSEDNEINIDEFDAKVIGDIIISKSEDIIDYFTQKTGLTHDVIISSFYNTEDREDYKRIAYIRNFDDSEGERRDVVQRWIHKIMNNISFNEDSIPEEYCTELKQYFSDYATNKINEWIEEEYAQCVEKEKDIDIEEINIDIEESGNEEETEEEDNSAKKKSFIDKFTEMVSDTFVEKSVSEIKKPPFTYELPDGKKVFINPKNIVSVLEEENEEDNELIRVCLDTGKEIVIRSSFYSFMDEINKK